MLDPKEKAKEIVENFTFNCRECDNAKQCALIAVDYIIGSIPTQPSSTEMERMDAIMFWINVKNEIENL